MYTLVEITSEIFGDAVQGAAADLCIPWGSLGLVMDMNRLRTPCHA